MATEKNSRWKRAYKGYQRFEESLETSVIPWVVLTGLMVFMLACAVAWSLFTGEPLLIDYSTPR